MPGNDDQSTSPTKQSDSTPSASATKRWFQYIWVKVGASLTALIFAATAILQAEQVWALTKRILWNDRSDIRWVGVADKGAVDPCRPLSLTGEVPPDKRLVVGSEPIEPFSRGSKATYRIAFKVTHRHGNGWIVDPGWDQLEKYDKREYKLYARLVSIKDWEAMAGGTGEASLYTVPSTMEAIESASDVQVYSAPAKGPC